MAKKKPKKPPVEKKRKGASAPLSKPVAKKPPPVTVGPVATSSVKVPDDRGEVMLYDAWKAGLPDLVEPPPEKLLSERQWWLVHFPSRKGVPVNGDRVEGLRQLKKCGRGEDEIGLLPPARAQQRARAREAGKGAQKELDEKKDKPPSPKKPRLRIKVDPSLSFDKALEFAFPNQFLIDEFCDVLRAAKPICDREGNILDWVPDYQVRVNMLTKLVEQSKGRAGEKPPPPPDKKKVSYQELESMILNSPATLAHFKSLIAKAEGAAKTSAPVKPEGGA